MKTKFLGLALAGITFCGVPATGEPILSLAGPATPVAVGASFTIDVNISGVTDLASYQFDVGYNPSLVTGLAVEEGPFLPPPGPRSLSPASSTTYPALSASPPRRW